MELHRILPLIAGAVLLATLAFTSPVVGVHDPGETGSAALGHGDATVDDVTVDHSPVITDGRFGTGVAYLRVSDARVRLSSVSGDPRIVYQIRIPELGLSRSGNRYLDSANTGTVSLSISPSAFEFRTLDQETYDATVVASVQSLDVDRSVYRENVTVEVRIDE